MYKAIKKFYCPFSKKRISPGEFIEIPEQYLSSYQGYVGIIAVIKPAEIAVVQPIEAAVIEKPVALKHLGGGWYELPNGERIRGKEAAMKAVSGSA